MKGCLYAGAIGCGNLRTTLRHYYSIDVDPNKFFAVNRSVDIATSRPSSVSNYESNFCFSVLSSIWRAGSKTESARFFDLFRTNCGKSAFSFRFGSESSKTNSEIQLPLFDLETEVPKRIVKSWVWLMTIRFGLATTTEWRKSTRTIVVHPDRVLVKRSTGDSHCQTEKCSDDQSSRSLYTSISAKRLLCTGSAFLGKYASIKAVDLIQWKKSNFRNFYLTEVRFDFLPFY